jgi:Predicted membrane protein
MTLPDWLLPFVSIDISLWEKVLRTVVVYLGIALLLRLAGKRLLAQMNSLDLVVVLLLSNVVQNAIIGPDNSVLGGLVGAVVLVGFNALADRAIEASERGRRLFIGGPSELVRDGRVDGPELIRMGVSRSELDIALRRQGSTGAEDVQRATLEPEGEILVDLKPGARPVTRDDLDAAVEELRRLLVERT